MKNITKSLLMIVAVAALAIGGTVAYFSDTETSTGNTFTTGTIDINVDGGQWNNTAHYAMNDMKPGYTDYTNFTIKNDGSNPANVWKKLSGMATTRLAGNEYSSHAIAELKDQIVYDLSVKVYRLGETTTPFWSQVIYTDAEGKTLTDVYGLLPTGSNGILLGMIPAGGHMDVVQSYHMKIIAGNEYQGEKMTYDMNLYAEQLINTVTMVPKIGANTDTIDQASTAKAVLTYNAKADKFDYTLAVSGMTDGAYTLISFVDPWPGSASLALANVTVAGGNANASSSIDINQDLTNAKFWLVPGTFTPGSPTGALSWSPANTLFETALANYIDPIK